MSRIFLIAAVFLTAAVFSHAQELAEAEKKDGFRPLFDGKTFEGWKTSDKTPKSWKIEGGLLMLTGGSSHLYTKDSFEAFVLRLEWRPAKKGYNSGVFIRGNNQLQMQQQNCGMLMSNTKDTKGVPRAYALKFPGLDEHRRKSSHRSLVRRSESCVKCDAPKSRCSMFKQGNPRCPGFCARIYV